MYLPMAVKNQAITLEDILTSLSSPPPYKLLYFNRISDLYRQVGIGEFLMSNDPANLNRQVAKGIQAYCEFLENAEESEKATSQINVLFDAIYLNDTASLSRLAKAAATTVNARKEYEEDFLYKRILLDLIGLGKEQEAIENLMKAFETLHNDNEDERFVLLRAYLDKEHEDFWGLLKCSSMSIRKNGQKVETGIKVLWKKLKSHPMFQWKLLPG